jgi:hypothetical protein
MMSRLVPKLCLLFVAVTGTYGQLSVRAAESSEPKVSETLRGVPLSDLLDKLSGPELRLTAAPEFRDVKVTLIVEDQPRSEVLRRLAQVFGAEYQVSAGAPPNWEFRRKRDVSDWLKLWQEARRHSEQRVRELQEAQVRSRFEAALKALDKPLPADENGDAQLPDGLGPLPLARFAKGLAPAEFDAVVKHVAAVSAIRAGGAALPAPPPIVRSFTSLPAPQQRLLEEWVGSSAGPGSALGAQRSGSIRQAVVTIGSDEGVGMDIHILWPSGDRIGGYAVSGAYGGRGMELYRHRFLFAELAPHATPEGALLGATITDQGMVKPGGAGLVGSISPVVRCESDALAAQKLRLNDIGAETRPPLRADFLAAAAKACKLNLIADYHTRSARLRGSGDDGLSGVLTAAAESYESVFRQEGTFLLARNGWWPDRDEEETPAPHPENWIRAKTGHRGLTLNDLGVMSSLTSARLDGLAAYRDADVNFDQEVLLARRGRWVWALLQRLSSAQKRQVESREGLDLARLDLVLRAYVMHAIPYQGSWDRIRLRVTHTEPSFVPDGSYGAQLLLPGSDTPLWSLP